MRHVVDPNGTRHVIGEPRMAPLSPESDAIIQLSDLANDDGMVVKTGGGYGATIILLLKTPRASWTAETLRGMFAVWGDDPVDPQTCDPIVSSTNLSITLWTHKVPTFPIRIMVPEPFTIESRDWVTTG